MTIGVGAGQMSRVYSTRIAAIKAADEGPGGEGLGHGLGRVLPVPRRHRCGGRDRHRGDHPARRLDARRRGHRRRPTSTAWRWCSPACATSGTDAHESSDHRRRRSRTCAGLEVRAVAAGRRGVSSRPATPAPRAKPRCRNVAVAADDIEALATLASDEDIGLTIVGPEAPLVAGIVDRFEARDCRCFGPSAAAAQLEGSKAFTKDFLARHNIPTAAYAELHRAGTGAAPIFARRARRSSSRPTASRPAKASSLR